MNMPSLLGVLAGLMLLFWAVGAYNRLVGLRNAIGQAWAQVEEPLRRRELLLPQWVDALQPALADDDAPLQAVLAASAQAAAASAAVKRRPGDADAAAAMVLAEQVLAGTVQRLRALLEPQAAIVAQAAGPALAACSGELELVEQKLAFRRQLFNQAVHRYNAAVRQFPTNLLTPVFRFGPAGRL